MKQEELKTFIDVVVGYFREATGTDAQMGIPYVKEKEAVIYDYTALIGISGEKKGGIFVTAQKELLLKLCGALLEMHDAPDDILTDMAGELANTIAGNVRLSFGSSFMISVPMILKGSADDIVIQLSPPVFIIPLEWLGTRASLAVGLE